MQTHVRKVKKNLLRCKNQLSKFLRAALGNLDEQTKEKKKKRKNKRSLDQGQRFHPVSSTMNPGVSFVLKSSKISFEIF